MPSPSAKYISMVLHLVEWYFQILAFHSKDRDSDVTVTASRNKLVEFLLELGEGVIKSTHVILHHCFRRYATQRKLGWIELHSLIPPLDLIFCHWRNTIAISHKAIVTRQEYQNGILTVGLDRPLCIIPKESSLSDRPPIRERRSAVGFDHTGWISELPFRVELVNTPDANIRNHCTSWLNPFWLFSIYRNTTRGYLSVHWPSSMLLTNVLFFYVISVTHKKTGSKDNLLPVSPGNTTIRQWQEWFSSNLIAHGWRDSPAQIYVED